MRTSIIKIKYGIALIFALSVLAPSFAAAQTQPVDSVDLNSSSFSIVVCDGPHNPQGDAPVNIVNDQGQVTGTRPYVVCDFNYAMFQIQHLIDIGIVLGVVVAILLFLYAGFLHITGVPANITKSYDIFKKVGIGFIIILSAWFIVYQIIAWLTGSSTFAVLLGRP